MTCAYNYIISSKTTILEEESAGQNLEFRSCIFQILEWLIAIHYSNTRLTDNHTNWNIVRALLELWTRDIEETLYKGYRSSSGIGVEEARKEEEARFARGPNPIIQTRNLVDASSLIQSLALACDSGHWLGYLHPRRFGCGDRSATWAPLGGLIEPSTKPQ